MHTKKKTSYVFFLAPLILSHIEIETMDLFSSSLFLRYWTPLRIRRTLRNFSEKSCNALKRTSPLRPKSRCLPKTDALSQSASTSFQASETGSNTDFVAMFHSFKFIYSFNYSCNAFWGATLWIDKLCILYFYIWIAEFYQFVFLDSTGCLFKLTFFWRIDHWHFHLILDKLWLKSIFSNLIVSVFNLSVGIFFLIVCHRVMWFKYSFFGILGSLNNSLKVLKQLLENMW